MATLLPLIQMQNADFLLPNHWLIPSTIWGAKRVKIALINRCPICYIGVLFAIYIGVLFAI